MKNTSMKKTILLFISLSFSLQAVAVEHLESKYFHTFCAATNQLVVGGLEPGLGKQIVRTEFKRHQEISQKLGASQAELEQLIRELGWAFDWERIVDLSEACTLISFHARISQPH